MNIFKKIINFIKSVVAEIKLVEWISTRKTLRLTGVVLFIALFISGSIAILDFIFRILRDRFI
jgi:preprotein translocase SecE subunit